MKKYVSAFVVAVIGASIPAQSLAAGATNLSTKESVTRGEFMRAAIQDLNIPFDGGTNVLPFKRVPRALLPYARAAHKRGALNVFGDDLLQARPITRGEAVRFMADLLGKRSTQRINFRDVRSGSPFENAVKVATENRWMQPQRDGYFGLTRRLRGSEAATLLRAAGGSGRATPVPTVRPRGGIKTTPRQQEKKDDVPTFRVNVDARTLSRGSLPKGDLMESVWRILNDDFLYEDKIDQEEAAYRAIEAIVESLDDPYTRFLRPQRAKNFQTQIQGRVSGIGAQVEDRAGVVTVVTPLTGSPAERSGVKPGDQIIAVDGESLKGVSFMDAVEMIRGPQGSVVQLTINRSGIELKINVQRDIVRVPEIEIKWQGSVAVVKLMQFGRLTETELRDELTKVQTQGPTGIVLDLRNNPGGLLHAANIVMSNFVPRGTVVANIVSRDDRRVDRTVEEPTIDASIPMVVIINSGSASASEIVAGALQDLGRARVVGEKSFGKGSVQEVLQFNDKSNLKVTIAKWQTPDGREIEGEGIIPDEIVGYENERDQQMLRALEILR